MRRNGYAVSCLILFHFDFIGVHDDGDNNLAGCAGFDGNGAVLVNNGDAGPAMNFEAVLLACLIGREGRNHQHQHYGYPRCSPAPVHDNLSPSPGSSSVPNLTTVYGCERSIASSYTIAFSSYAFMRCCCAI